MEFFIILMVVMTMFALLCRHLAIKKGLNEVFWLAMGLTFGPLALLVLSFKK